MEIKKGLYFVGVFDGSLRRFDIIMSTKFGTSYNAFLVVGEKKTCLIETVKLKFYWKMLEKIKKVLNGKPLDYLVHNHTEPDHSGSSIRIIEEFPNVEVIASENGLTYLQNIWNETDGKLKTRIKTRVVGNGNGVTTTKIDLGGQLLLEFFPAPFLHWPDSMFTYCEKLSTVFTCDVLGSHFCFENVISSKIKRREDYLQSFEYYYSMIFGPFKKYVLKGMQILRKLMVRGLTHICCSHGPVLDSKIGELVTKYETWSTVKQKFIQQVVIVYVSSYGYTKEMAMAIEKGVVSEGVKCVMYDPVVDKEGKIGKELSQSKGVVFGTPTILADCLPNIWKFLKFPWFNPIVSQGQVAGSFGSYGWSGEGTKNIDQRLQQLKLKLPLDPLRIRFKPTKKDLEVCSTFGKKFAKAVKGEEINERTMEKKKKGTKLAYPNDGKLRVWKCVVCGEKITSIGPPKQCPACSVLGEEIWVIVKVIEEGVEEPKSDYAGKICVIGGGTAGIEAVKSIRKANEKSKVFLFSEEGRPYYRPTLTKVFQYALPEDWFVKNNVSLISEKVVDVNDTKKELRTNSGKMFSYDKLILATGSRANNFFCKKSYSNVFTLYNERDIKEIFKYLKEFKGKAKVGIVGAGLLGIEFSELLILSGFKERIDSITMIEMADRIMPRQLDFQGGKIYSEVLKQAGLKIKTGTEIKKLVFDEKKNIATHIEINQKTLINEHLSLNHHGNLPVDVVLISVGSKPNLEFAKVLKLETCKGKGLIKVNDKMETSRKGIYAAGNIAQFGFFCIPNFAMALVKGEVAGSNAIGIEKKFARTICPYSLHSFHCNVFSSGKIETESFVSRKIDGEYLRLSFQKAKDGKMQCCGALFIARPEEKAPAAKLIDALEKKISIAEAYEVFF